MLPAHLNFPPSPTGFLCVHGSYLSDKLYFCTAMIMGSSFQDGQTSLILSSKNGHIEVVRMLLSAGVNVDLQDKVSTTSPSQGSMVTFTLMCCCGLEGYVHTIVMEIMSGACTCVVCSDIY